MSVRRVGATVGESTGVQRYVNRLLGEWSKQEESRRDEKAADSTSSEDRIRELQFVAALLKDRPKDRATAAQACREQDRPSISSSVALPADTLKNVRRRSHLCPLMQRFGV